eukprot:g2887.t1
MDSKSEASARSPSSRRHLPANDKVSLEELQQELELARTQAAEEADAAEVLQQVKDSLTLQLTQLQSCELRVR